MNHFIVNRSSLHGEIVIPPSKSHSLRAILFGSLGEGESIIENYLPSTDAQAMIKACELLGASLEISPTTIRIRGLGGKVNWAEDVIDAGNSGIVLRFCAAVGALASHPIVITGDYSIRHQRPMKTLLSGLQQLGVSAKSMRGDDYAPIIVQGPLLSGKATIEGSDSQPVSALLIAAAFADGPIEIEVSDPGEKPWIALTLDWLDRLGIPYQNDDFRRYRLEGGHRYKGFHYVVPGDLSSAAFPLAAAIVTGSELTLKNVDMSDCQGDKELITIFQKMGAYIEIDEQKKILRVKKGNNLSGVVVDINRFVDAITILAVVACFAEGETIITNGAVAKQKECNRIQSIATELRKMGADVEETEDGLRIRGKKLHGSKELFSHHDHRMAMSLAVAALGCSEESKIADTDCVAKTFPTFLKEFQRLGAKIERLNHG